MITTQRSRPADDGSAMLPFSKLFEMEAQCAQQAEVLLQRKLLIRSFSLLQAFAAEARSENTPDAVAEELMRDISAALDKQPTLI
ncbi:MAG: hypothetical protein BWZ07_03096 [Alphaproteobacteria bacterium ADurb.BinA280]|nr:MAG: hypothetical protein BWZ07_03096 [Alphaproteobacteria bacterium ADurb.BinA280]